METYKDNIIKMLEGYYVGSLQNYQRAFFNSKINDYDYIDIKDFSKASFLIGQKIKRLNIGKEICLILCTTPLSILQGFYGAICANLIPLIVPTKGSFGDDESISETITNILDILGDRFTILTSENYDIEKLGSFQETLCDFKVPEEVGELKKINNEIFESSSIRYSQEIAFFQMTSGSTGSSKLVVVGYDSLLKNVKDIYENSNCKNEIGVSWLPLHHDMGLVGVELFTFFSGIPLFLMSPYDFLKRPLRWLTTISDHNCTITAAPNFSYDYCTSLIGDIPESLSLSSWRVTFNGAEPIHAKTIDSFIKKFHPYGFRVETFFSCYGQAENTLAVTLPEYGLPVRCLELGQSQFILGEKVKIISEDFIDLKFTYSENKTYVVCVGTSIPSSNIRLFNGDIEITAEGVLGEIVVGGECIARGYLIKGEKVLLEFNKSHRSGDLGFILNSNLYIIDRIKNIVIKNGENYSADLLEKKVSDLLNISRTSVAIFQTDILNDNRICALIESPRSRKKEDFLEILERHFNLPIDTFYLSKKRCIPKTSGGKIRHSECKNVILKASLQPYLETISK